MAEALSPADAAMKAIDEEEQTEKKAAQAPAKTTVDTSSSPPPQGSTTPPLELGRSPAEISRMHIDAEEQAEAAKNAPPPETTSQWLKRNLIGEGQAAGHGLAAGAATVGAGFGIPGLIGSAANWALGTNQGPNDPHTIPYPSDYLNTLAKAGLYDPKWKPQSFPEQLVSDEAAAVPSALLGPFNKLGPVLERTGYTLGSAGAGSVMNQLGIPNWITDPLVTIPASGVHKWVSDAAERSAAQKAAAQAEAELNAQKMASKGVIEQRKIEKIQNTNATTDFTNKGQADIERWHDSEHTGADADREAVAANLGISKTAQEGTASMQDVARNWKKNDFPTGLKNAENDMYSSAPTIPEDARGNLNGFEDSLKNSFYKAGDLEPIAQRLRSRLPEGLENAVDQIRKKYNLAEGAPLEATLNDMKKLRSILGDAMGDKSLMAGVDAGKMNELYRGLSDDMEGAISNAAGPAGVAKFHKFNEEAKRLYGIASGPVSDIISTTDKAQEHITPYELTQKDNLWKDSTKLAQLRSEPTLNGGVNEVAAGRLRGGGRDAEKDFGTMTPEGQKALYGQPGQSSLQGILDKRETIDKGKDTQTKLLGEQATQKTQQEAIARAAEIRARGETTEGLTQAEKAAQARLDAAVNPQQRMLKYMHDLVEGGVSSAAGWLGASHFQPMWDRKFAPLGTGHSLIHHALSPIGAAALAGTGAGLRQLVNNPNARVNLLRGAAAGNPSLWNADQSGQTP